MSIMTEGQRDYLADLANRKGVRVEGTDSISQAAASKKIDELKALPDATFPEISPEQEIKFANNIVKINGRIWRWTMA